MVDLTVDKIIDVQTRIIEASGHQEDEGTGGLVRDFGTLDYLVDEAHYIDDSYRSRPDAVWYYCPAPVFSGE